MTFKNPFLNNMSQQEFAVGDYIECRVGENEFCRVKIYECSSDGTVIKAQHVDAGTQYVFTKHAIFGWCAGCNHFEVTKPTEKDKENEKTSYWLNY